MEVIWAQRAIDRLNELIGTDGMVYVKCKKWDKPDKEEIIILVSIYTQSHDISSTHFFIVSGLYFFPFVL